MHADVPKVIEFSNSINITNRVNDVGFLTNKIVDISSGLGSYVLFSEDMEPTLTGNVAQRTQQGDYTIGGLQQIYMKYDGNNFLQEVQQFFNNNHDTVNYRYDTMGNIAAEDSLKSVGNKTFGYSGTINLANTSNLLTDITNGLGDTYNLDYDYYGNITGYRDNSFSNSGKNFTYSYAAENYLRSVTNNNNPNKAMVYDYDGDGLMVKRRFRVDSGSGYVDESIVYSVYAKNGLLMAEYSPTGNWYSERIYLGRDKIAERRFTNILDGDDSDQDGMPDKYEIVNQLRMLDATDANLDNDGDSVSNLQEYLSNTNPNDPNL